MAKISKTTVDAVQAGEKDAYLWDSALRGFGLKVTPSGRKVYLVQYRIGGRAGRTRRVTIGAHGTITADFARSEAQTILRTVSQGKDPMAEKDSRRGEQTTGDLLDQFLAEHAGLKLKTRSSDEYRRLVAKLIPAQLKRKPITEVARADLSRLHHSLRATPYQANRVLAVLSKFFNWCEKNGFRPDHSNPALHVDKFKEEKRKRYLSEAELAKLGNALALEEGREGFNPHVVAAIRLLSLTGARLNEILTLRWDEVDFEAPCLRLSDSKTGAKSVYLNAPASSVLASIPRIEGNPHVICGDKAGSHLMNLQKPWRRLRALAGLDDVRIHDLRHSFASVAVASGMSLPLIGALLGHSQPQTTARYAHLSDDPLKAAAELIGKRIGLAQSTIATQVVNNGR